MDESFMDLWDSNTQEYVIISDSEKNVLHFNGKVRSLLNNAANSPETVNTLINAKNNDIISINRKKFMIHNGRNKEFRITILRDCTKEQELEEQVNNLTKLAQDYEMLFDRFGDSNMYITDQNGNTTWVGSSVAETCGVGKEYLLGKNVYELEEQGIFFPSITIRVLESLKDETLIQTTLLGTKAIAMGFPIFDKNNKLQKVISFSKVIQKKSDLDDFSFGKYRVDRYYPEVITNRQELKTMIDLCCRGDFPFTIYGETGSEKESVAKCIHKLGNRCSYPFKAIYAETMTEDTLKSKLFGESDFREGILTEINGGTLFISGLTSLSYELQNILFKIIRDSGYTDENGEFYPLNIRYIAGITEKAEEDKKDGQICRMLFYQVGVMKVFCPPLRERRDDIPLLIRYFMNLFLDIYGVKKNFNANVLQYLYAYNWYGNFDELKQFVENYYLNDKKSVLGVEDLPYYVINNQNIIDGNPLFYNRVVPMDQAVMHLEKHLIKMALLQSENGIDAAKKLGITQSTLSRKMQKYNITRDYR
ncbi:Anaerobic nitric oxide reductase transcription regulator NorR [bioreactor metagenome]|uniref:Anaerobic nitric oxide reductase transcription regulator NorR n=1 Tax=bioreactor metagenome TaxID=1076179 RepID=A0A644Y7T3_9ZZZZ|nr:sigma 54-interacting transcriptional regulator [Bacteroidaceae bacterium]MEA4973837.1 sigma 54-interacting transcriptional regulator [Candidatus Metalachnospira sp.]